MANIFKEYSDEDIVQDLIKSGRECDAQLYCRWIKIRDGGGSYKDLKGGNVYFTGISEIELKLNRQNEFLRIVSIQREFGHLVPSIIYLSLQEYEDILKWSRGDNDGE
jgi:hypothetical protein